MVLSTLIAFAAVVVILALLAFFGQYVLCPVIVNCGDWMAEWITIPILGKVIFWGQAVAVAIAVAIRIYIGIKEGLLANGGPKPPSFGEYMFKSVFSVAMVGLMPVFCQLVMMFGQTMMGDVLGVASVSKMSNLTVEYNWETLKSYGIDDLLNGGFSLILARSVFVVIGLLLVAAALWALLKRQVEMLVVSVVAPWVGIKISTTNDEGQYAEFLANLFGMCVTQWAQYLFLMIGVNAFFAAEIASGDLFAAIKSGLNYSQVVVALAILAVSVGLPSLLDRWTYTGGSSGIRGFVVGTALRAPMTGGLRAGMAAMRAMGNGAGAAKGKMQSAGKKEG